MPFRFSAPLYPIIDLGRGVPVVALAEAILTARVPLLQLRAKLAPTGELVEIARRLQTMASRHDALLIINDRPDVARLVDADGVHLGQDDLPVEVARDMLGPDKIIGLSTHNAAQVTEATRSAAASYIAFGPIFPTRSKENPDPVQGIDGLREARKRCELPLVAIGGIDRGHLAELLRSGADAVAVIGALAEAASPAQAAADLLHEASEARETRGAASRPSHEPT